MIGCASDYIIRLVAAGAGGAAIALSFPPLSLWPGVFVGVTLIVVSVAGVSARFALVAGLAAGIVGHAIAFAWLWTVLPRFTQATVPTTAAYVAVFLAYHATQLALSAALVIRRGDGKQSVVVRAAESAAAWVILEWCFPKIFPWSLADGLASSATLRQAVDVAGPYGLSFAAVATSALLASSVDGQVEAGIRWRATAAAGLVLSALGLYGAVRLSQFTNKRSLPKLQVTVIQGGVGMHADARVETEVAWKTYEPLTIAAARDAGEGLVIWPETILRSYFQHDGVQLLRARRLVSRLKQSLLFGTLALPAAGHGELNVALLIRAGGDARSIQTYEKLWLLPFAEYVPGARLKSWLRDWRTTGDFVRGEEGGPLELSSGAVIAPAICFEVLRPGAFNRLVRRGAGLLVNLSDDGWFGGTVEPEQHLQSATLRAVETRRWLVRSSDSGISAVIDPTGEITHRLDTGTVGSLQVVVPLESEPTPYVWLGDWVIPFCVALTAARLRRADRAVRLWRWVAIRRRS